ncbi:hypothetical protein I5Q34_25825 [Streptomyces sp. AV19]|uniref:hypothetical protein n=1 Tax=Streptomyces sp. AV19 TaxID=2793068 RepID=UPI0018FE6940|nr:hypothetical protein [Streptomyces sp. AV19]MBH1937648.1 hypothetical protein [Streptomyces sp. AV19]MDG4536317.1 hypothetical protein [Streptomyces sp. AV19]
MAQTPKRSGATKAVSWGFAVAMAVMAVGVVVDWFHGEGLDWGVAALQLLVLPYAVGEVLRAHGRARAAAVAGTVSNWLLLPAAAILWTGLIVGWSRDEGTPWLPFTAAVLLPAGAAAMGTAALRRRRAAV